MEGFSEMFDGKVKTVWSAPNYTYRFGNKASGHYGLAIGYNSCAMNIQSQAYGFTAKSTGNRALSSGWQAEASAGCSNAIGYQSRGRVACTTNITGAMITKKDSGSDAVHGETAATSFYQYSSAEITLMTKNIDLKATGTNDITVPSGSTFYISEMGVIITEWNTVTAQPTVKIGNSSDDDKQLDDIQLSSNLSGAGKRVRFLPANPDDGETLLRITVINAATATTMKGRFYFKGMLIEDQ